MSAFELFSARSIEAVSLMEIAAHAGSGIATLYKYFLTKQELSMEAAAEQWQLFWQEKEQPLRESLAGASAAGQLDSLLEEIIALCEQKPALLRFTGNFESYMRHEQMPEERLAGYKAAVQPAEDLFRGMAGCAREDGTVRTDMPEAGLFQMTLGQLFASAVRCSEGSLWQGEAADPAVILRAQKEMILRWALTEKGIREIYG